MSQAAREVEIFPLKCFRQSDEDIRVRFECSCRTPGYCACVNESMEAVSGERVVGKNYQEAEPCRRSASAILDSVVLAMPTRTSSKFCLLLTRLSTLVFQLRHAWRQISGSELVCRQPWSRCATAQRCCLGWNSSAVLHFQHLTSTCSDLIYKRTPRKLSPQ